MDKNNINFFADGVGAPIPPTPGKPGYFRNPNHKPVETNEGPRGWSLRASVPLRYFVYFVTILFCSAVTQWAFSSQAGGSRYDMAGTFMFIAAALMVGTGAVSTWFYAASRREIIAMTRHYVFGVSLLPGTAVALLYRASMGWLRSGEGGGGVFVSLTSNALPLVFFSTVVIPTVVFIGQLAGRRYLERSRMDDQEALALWTRQDGMQR